MYHFRFVKYFFYCSIVFFLLFSCEEEFTIDLPAGKQGYIIEGYIENGFFPDVLITRDAEYFASVDTSEIKKYLVSGAEVIVTTDGISYRLTESEFIPGYYTTQKLTGEINKSYELTVKIGEEIFTAKTTIPPPLLNAADSFWYEPKISYDSVVRVLYRYTDPDTIGNYVRIFSKVGDDLFRTSFVSVFDDKFINGKTFTDRLYNGQNEKISCFPESSDTDTSKPYIRECGLFRKNTTVKLKISSIDKDHYNFWRTFEKENHSHGPFSNPTIIQSNINGAFGIWGGYGSVIYTIELK